MIWRRLVTSYFESAVSPNIRELYYTQCGKSLKLQQQRCTCIMSTSIDASPISTLPKISGDPLKGQSHELLNFIFRSWQSNQCFLYDRFLFKIFFAALLLRNLNMKFYRAPMKLLTILQILSVTLSKDPPADFRKPPMRLEPVFIVMKIVLVSRLWQCYPVKAFGKPD